MNPVLQQLQAEASRRFAGQPASNVGTQPNPSASQSVTQPQANPLASRQGMSSPSTPTMPSAGDPFGGASDMMNGAMPMKGGTAIEKALIKRMQMYPPA
jgi:hypothetical protein